MTEVQDTHQRQRAIRAQNDFAAREAPTAGAMLACWCECHDPDCRELLDIELSDYRQARQSGGFIVVLAHVDRSTERFVLHFRDVAVVVPRGLQSEPRHAAEGVEPEEAGPEEDGSLLDALQEKISSVMDTPRPADYDRSKTNPVTGMRREP